MVRPQPVWTPRPGASIPPCSPPALLKLFGLLGMVVLASGCVHVYQPLTGLHRPIVADPTVRNFEALDLTVHCVPSKDMSRAENLTLCRRVSTLFENQGARVTTIDTAERIDPDEPDSPPGEGDGQGDGDGGALILELRSRLVERRNPALSAVLCSVSFTLIPAVEDETHAIDLTVRDEDGFLLLRDTLKWRFIRRYGAGVWAGNQILDWLVRDEAEKRGRDGRRDLSVGKKTAGADLSEDLYGQLTQILYNARMRRSVLHEVGPADPWGRP